MKLYCEDHQWVEEVNGVFYVGLSVFGAEELGEVNFVELPELGCRLAADQVLSVIESVKAASDVMAPIGGKVTAVNEKLRQEPELLNQDPEGQGWICQMQEVEETGMKKMMTEQQYKVYLETTGSGN